MVIDFGSGMTSAAAFMDGGLIHVETLPMGGARASSDLAQGLGTTFAAAERLKTLHGAVGLSEVAALEMVDAPKLGPDGRLEAHQCTRAQIAQVLRPRIEEIFELMDMRLSKASAAGRPLPRRIVLTGGSSQLPVFTGACGGCVPRAGASRPARECQRIGRDVQFSIFRRCGRLATLGADGRFGHFAGGRRPGRWRSRVWPIQSRHRLASGKFLSRSAF